MQLLLAVLQATGAQQVLQLGATSHGFCALIGRQAAAQRWTNRPHEWDGGPSSDGQPHLTFTWHITESGGYLLDSLSDEQRRLTWLLLHLVPFLSISVYFRC